MNDDYGPRWYDRAGQPLGMEEWATLLSIYDYQRVAETSIGRYWVSTVWLGLDHDYLRRGPPLIFETAVFAPDGSLGPDIDMRRYSTEAEALAGHEETCLLIQAATIQEAPPEGEPHTHDRKEQ